MNERGETERQGDLKRWRNGRWYVSDRWMGKEGRMEEGDMKEEISRCWERVEY